MTNPPNSSFGTNTWDVLLARLRDGLRGEFRVTRELGRGGQAAVYLAEEIALRRQVAIKVLAGNPNYVDDDAVARFQAEAITIASFNHPHIVTIFSNRKLGSLPYFIMQYLEGQSLASVLVNERRLSWPLVRPILQDVGSALQYAHSRGVVHRDVKPANIIFDEDGNAVVTDFGIARKLTDASITNTVQLVGTAAYISPEQCHGERVTPAADQYALGIAAYQMLVGRVPFVGSEMEVLRGHTEGQIPPLHERAPDCPAPVAAAITRMLAKKPADRFPSVEHALNALGIGGDWQDDATRDRIRKISAPRHEVRGRMLTPTYGFAAKAGARFLVLVPKHISVGDTDQCSVVLEQEEDIESTPASSSKPRARFAPTTLPVQWSVTPAESAVVNVDTGLLTAVRPGPITVHALINSEHLTASIEVTARSNTENAATLRGRDSAARPDNLMHAASRRTVTLAAAGVVTAAVALSAWLLTGKDPAGVADGNDGQSTSAPGRTDSQTDVAPTDNILGIPASPSWVLPENRYRARLASADTSSLLRWFSTTGAMRIDSITGQVSVSRPGTDTLVAMRQNERLATLAVRSSAVRLIDINVPRSMTVDDSADFMVRPIDADGNTIERRVTITPLTPQIVRIESDGFRHRIVALQEGVVIINVRVEGRSRELDITVNGRHTSNE